MKTAIYIEDGELQVVLTPETEWEKKVTEEMKDGARLSIKRGSFYYCQGGWYRQGSDEKSIMLSILKPDCDVKMPGTNAV